MRKNSFNTRTKKKAQFGNWKVDEEGNLDHMKKPYFITADRLNEEDWLIHLAGKSWIDWNEFISAYFQALKNAEIQFIKMRVFW